MNLTGELRLYPYPVTIPLTIRERWYQEVGNGCHILHPRVSDVTDYEIKEDLKLMFRMYQGLVEGHFLIQDPQDPENTVRIYLQKAPDRDFRGNPVEVWSPRSAYEGEESYATEITKPQDR